MKRGLGIGLRVVGCFLALCGLSRSAGAYQPASTPYKTFIAQSELVVWGTLVRWEKIPAGDRYTFKVTKRYRGPQVDELVLTVPMSMDMPIANEKTGCEGFLFLRQEDGAWVFAKGGGFWPHRYAMTAKLQTIRHVEVGPLLSDLPEGLAGLRKKTPLVTVLANGKQHRFEAAIYMRDDVDAWLASSVK